MDDVVVLGAGAVGLSTALHAARGGARVAVLEKEAAAGRHQSRRNSGVVHAGYNLSPGSQKARFALEGARRLRAYCEERGVACQELGVVVVARDDADRPAIQELERRGRANGVRGGVVDGDGLRRLEPHVAGVAAYHCPEVASFDAGAYVDALARDVEAAGGVVRTGVRALAVEEHADHVHVRTPEGGVRARVAINAAGLHADRLARARDLRIVPFRGYYAELAPPRRHLVRGHVYGAPDLRFPFLGIHLSRRVDGRVIVGPGAMLAFGREAYRLRDVHVRDLAATLAWPGFWRLLAQAPFRRLVRSEVAKSLSRRAVAAEARRLVPGLTHRDLARSFAGNRAQVVDRHGNLVMDVVVRTTERCIHVLNAVSPGLTASLPFGEHLAAQALERL